MDGSWSSIANESGLVVIELHDNTEVFRAHDQTGLQDVTSAVTLNAANTMDFTDSASFTRASASAVDCTSASDVQIVQMDYANIGIYTDSTGGSAYGGTTPNVVNLDNNVIQTDTTSIERSGDVVTIKGDNKRYLVMYCVSGNTGGDRTQRIGQLEIDGVADVATRSYA